MRTTRVLPSFVAALISSLAITASAADYEEGGYCGAKGISEAPVYNFLKHFGYEQYYYSVKSQFESSNNSRVDAMDFSVFCGHGSPWTILGSDNLTVDLSKAGSKGNLGYGETDCEFIAFESCQVVPSPIEKSDWYTNWTKSGGVFDGLHQAVGYHTNAHVSTAANIMWFFGLQVHADLAIWQSWFMAIDIAGAADEYGTAVMYPAAEYDTYSKHCADPPKDHTSLKIWYQY